MQKNIGIRKYKCTWRRYSGIWTSRTSVSLPKRFKTSPTVHVSKNSGTEACVEEIKNHKKMNIVHYLKLNMIIRLHLHDTLENNVVKFLAAVNREKIEEGRADHQKHNCYQYAREIGCHRQVP